MLLFGARVMPACRCYRIRLDRDGSRDRLWCLKRATQEDGLCDECREKHWANGVTTLTHGALATSDELATRTLALDT